MICPSTLCRHWVTETTKFVSSSKSLRPMLYTGSKAARQELAKGIHLVNMVVAPYEAARSDVEVLSQWHWNYVVLDEGHAIKNGRAKTTLAVKRMRARHRLILSGTPIQNSVLELWSLFDFLMPGFLGTERQFNSRFSRPIVASRDPKCTPKDQEAGALAMEALHRQVLPFVLRRMKEDVLKDLPPKITQDFYCDLSPVQVRIYEHFARAQAALRSRTGLAHPEPQDKTKSHAFQALQYLRKVCNHPKLVLDESHQEWQAVSQMLQQSGSTLDDIHHAAKLPALQDLLLQCGIGATCDTSADVVVQHRALVFCQMKAMMDIVEEDLLRRRMPGVTYLRLDGSVPAAQRQTLVDRFNSDISIDVLLLSTSVGGQGLNLTGADTVIFVEHDWNPMKDLQAMDRAHRIGQKKVRNFVIVCIW